MPKIFISYRRDDSLHATGRIYDRLATAFGEANVFKDVDSMPLGIDFRKALNNHVAQCDVLLAVIGDDWLSAAEPGGSRRLDDEADYVRIEIEAALKRDIPVVPLLIGNAPLPKPKDLPETMSQLAYRNGTTLREDPHFRSDVDRVVKALSHIGQPTPGPTPPGPPHIEIVAAEHAGPPPPHLSGGWQIQPLASHSKSAGAGLDWLALGRWSLLAIVAPLPYIFGGGYEDNFALPAMMYACLAPVLLFAGFPWVYEKVWKLTRGASGESYEQHMASGGRLPYTIIYVATVAGLLLFGALAVDALWTSMLPEEKPDSSSTSGDLTKPDEWYNDPSLGYKSLTEAYKEGLEGSTEPESESKEPALDPESGPFSDPGSPFTPGADSTK